jgi:BMFP domain-containing protein YqiC
MTEITPDAQSMINILARQREDALNRVAWLEAVIASMQAEAKKAEAAAQVEADG